MFTILLYHGFVVRGYHHLSTRHEGGNVVFTIEQDLTRLTCPCCGGKQVSPKKGPPPSPVPAQQANRRALPF